MPPELTPTVAFKQQVIALDSAGQSLRLRRDAALRLNLVTQEFDVVGWGLRMKLRDVESLPREMARQYLLLWSRSERRQLHGDDAGHWAQILEQVDFQAFCNERAPYLYVEGEVLGRSREGTVVKWADGREETVRGRFGKVFDMVNPGELFSASAKQDRTGRLSGIEHVTVLGDATQLLREVDDDWIQKG
jgi:hypothetical protein